MRPSRTCVHSWQNTMYGLPPSENAVPSSAAQSFGVTGPSLHTSNGPSGAFALNTHVPRRRRRWAASGVQPGSIDSMQSASCWCVRTVANI